MLREADYLRMRFDGFIEGDKIVARRRRRRRHRRLFGQYRAQDGRGHRALRHRSAAPRLHQLAPLQGRLPALAARRLNCSRLHLDPNNHNGAVFLGLNGLVVKSHGSANAKGVANAIRVAARMVRDDLTRKIAEDLDNFSRPRVRTAAAPMSRRSVIVGTGSALPPRAGHQRRAGRAGRHHRRMDRRAHRHPRPPHRRRRRDHRDAGDRGRAQGARRGRRRRRARST